MRKWLFVILLVLLTACCAAALADTNVSLSPAPAQVTVKDKNRTVLTPSNLDQNTDFLRQLVTNKASVTADFEARGVILQAWEAIKQRDGYSCLEITVTQDDDAAQFFDLIHHPGDREKWNEYTASVKNSSYLSGLGYTIQGVEIKHAQDNYYLLVKYKRTTAAGEYFGYMAKTVFRGYSLTFDLQAYNRWAKTSDANFLYNAIRTLQVVDGSAGQGGPAPNPSGTVGTGTGDGTGTDGTSAPAAAPLTITSAPPLETNTNKFTVEGTTVPGAQVIGVLMRITSSEPLRFETTSHARNGSFKINVTIPEAEESVWLMTLNVFVDDQLVADTVFNTTTYKKTLIPVTFDAEVPESVPGDELVISGTTIKGVDIQCIVNHPESTWGPKTSRPNGTGRFSFKIPTKNEGEYSITLVFTKKDMETKRFTYTVTRNMSEEARRIQIRKQATSVGYGTLTARIDQYVGKTLSFSAWVTGIEQIGDEWRISAAGAKTGDHYSQRMVFMTAEEPELSVEEKHTFFGKCIGPYQIQSEESTERIPSFDLFFFD